MLKKILLEPLVQFFIIALLLILVIDLFSTEDLFQDSESEIRVTDLAIEKFVQFKAKKFKSKDVKQYITSMTKDEKNDLVDQYVRSEVLFREALSLGLNNNDDVIRRRLIQKMEFISQGSLADLPAIEEKEIVDYFNENKQFYTQAETLSFTHIYFPRNQEKLSEKYAYIVALKRKLNDDQVPFEKAAQYGNRFLYNRNYLERDKEYIASHFGDIFSEKVFNILPSEQWQGPFSSDYGEHLVMLRKKVAAKLPDVSEVAPRILTELRRIQLSEFNKKKVDKLVENYQVINELSR